jgi:hypothetical protein
MLGNRYVTIGMQQPTVVEEHELLHECNNNKEESERLK